MEVFCEVDLVGKWMEVFWEVDLVGLPPVLCDVRSGFASGALSNISNR